MMKMKVAKRARFYNRVIDDWTGKRIAVLFGLAGLLFTCGCGDGEQASHEYEQASVQAIYRYEQESVHAVAGRQGVCTEGGYYWVSGSATLTKYDSNWNLVAENGDPFKGYELEVNHIGDIDVYNNELYLGVEYFMDGEGRNIQVAVYDGDADQNHVFLHFQHCIYRKI